MKYISNLLNSKKTVFWYQDLMILCNISNKNSIKYIAKNLVKNNILINIYSGVFCLYNYDIYELVNKIKSPSYISFETVLYKAGLIFQYSSNQFFLVSNDSRNKIIKSTNSKVSQDIYIIYKKIKDDILYNPIGIINVWNYQIASPERAICDTIYINPDYYFDNLSWVNFELLTQISYIYPKSTQIYISQIIQNATNSNSQK